MGIQVKSSLEVDGWAVVTRKKPQAKQLKVKRCKEYKNFRGNAECKRTPDDFSNALNTFRATALSFRPHSLDRATGIRLTQDKDFMSPLQTQSSVDLNPLRKGREEPEFPFKLERRTCETDRVGRRAQKKLSEKKLKRQGSGDMKRLAIIARRTEVSKN